MIPALLLAAAALPASAAPASRAAPARVGVSTATAEAELRLLLRCPQRAPLDASALLADPAGRADAELLFDSEEARELAREAACRDLRGEAGACASLNGLGGAFAGKAAGDCRAIAAHDRFVFLVVRGGDALADCVRIFEPEGKGGAAAERGCRAFLDAERKGDPLSACPVLEREKLIGPGDDCADNLSSWTGKPEACAAVKDAEARRECRERAALVAGLRAPAACAASPACRALTSKDAAACAAPREELSRRLCGRLARQSAESQRRLELEKTLRGREQLQREADFKREAEAKAKREAAVKAKAEAEAKAAAAAKAKIEAQAAKPQFKKGQPMKRGGDIKEIMKKLEKGQPLPAAKPEGEEPGGADQ